MLPFVKFRMPESSHSGDVAYNDNQIGVKFSKAGSKRFLKCDFWIFTTVRIFTLILKLMKIMQKV